MPKVFNFLARSKLKRCIFSLLFLIIVVLPAYAQNNQYFQPMLNYRRAFQNEDQATALQASQNAHFVAGQPTRQKGDISAANACESARIAQEWLERVEYDIASHKDWHNDLATVKKAINNAAKWSRLTALAARTNGDFWGGKIKEINYQAADNCEAAALIAEQATTSKSNWAEAQKAADRFYVAGKQAIESGYPVAGYESLAAASIARIATRIIKVENSTKSVNAQLKPSQPLVSKTAQAKMLPQEAQTKPLLALPKATSLYQSGEDVKLDLSGKIIAK